MSFRSNSAVLAASGRRLGEVVGGGDGLWSTMFGAAPAQHFIEITGRVILDIDATAFGVEILDGGELVFDPDSSRLLRIDSHTLMVMAGGKLTMMPSSPSITHELRFVNVDEATFTAGGDMDTIDHHLNPGLMVMDGTVELVGAAKTGWTRTTHAMLTGATTCTVVDASGWRIGDEIVIMPTELTSVSNHWAHFDRRTLTNVVGNVLTFAATTFPHPSNTSPLHGVVLYPEVINLTRNVKISGDFEPGSGNVLGQTRTNGRAQVMFMGGSGSPSEPATPTPSILKYVEALHLGPRKIQVKADGTPEPPFTNLFLGRYGLHWHKMYDGSFGTVVEGCSLHDLGSRAYVPHGSHGITFTDCVAWSCFEQGWWWDSPDTVPDPTMENESNDIMIDRCFVGRVRNDGTVTGILNSGFFLAGGVRTTIKNCCVSAIDGGTTTAGYMWPEGLGAQERDVWVFHDNDVHNLRNFGSRVWQNNGEFHNIDRFRSWNNHQYGLNQGAYRTSYNWHDIELWGNRLFDLLLNSNSAGTRRQLIADSYMQTIHVSHAKLPLQAKTLLLRISGITSVVLNEGNGIADNPTQVDFVDCGLTPAHFTIGDLGMDPLTVNRVQTGASAWQLTSSDTTTLTVTPIPVFYP